MNIHSRDVEATDDQNPNARNVPSHEPESPAPRTPRDEGTPSITGTVDSLEDVTKTQLLKRLVRAIEWSEWDSNTVIGFLKQMVESTGTHSAPPQPTQLDLDPRSRMLIPGPGLVDYPPEHDLRLGALTACARWNFQRSRYASSIDYEVNRPGAPCPHVFIVIGLFEGPDMAPKERCVYISHHRWVFWSLWWGIVRLRGLRSIFSLKDCTAFRIYTCPKGDPEDQSKRFHKQLSCNQQDLNTLAAFRRSWGLSSRLASFFGASNAHEVEWTRWIHRILNDLRDEPDSRPDSNQLSLEIVLGWSPLRITIVVLGPILLSLAVGLWFQSRNWTDLATIQAAWGIASYIVTAGSLVAALLAILSSVGDR